MKKNTICVHTGGIKDTEFGSTSSVLYPGTAYEYLEGGDKYPRYFNIPNQKAVVDKVCKLEHAEDGLLFSSGMAAISTTIMALTKPGDHIIFQFGLYGGTTKFITHELEKLNIEYSFLSNNSRNNFLSAIKKNTKLIYIETPTNPLLNITSLKDVSSIAKTNNLITVIDNTFASPINQNPIDFGIDIVIHSATKYLGGHSDICAGIAVSSKEIISKTMASARCYGGSLNAQICHFLERSIKTLNLRVQQQNKNALTLAEYLEQHPKVSKVNYPGLKSHPDHDIAVEQMKGGFGGMLSFELDETIDSLKFQKKLNIIEPAMSLGGIDTTICASALTSHKTISKEQRQLEGISDNLLRISTGIEDVEDLIEDFEYALT